MSPVSLLLNILWVVLGGAWMAVGWVVAAIIMALTIIGLPWAKACFTLASYTLAPFGRELASRSDVTGRESIGTGGLGFLANVLWFLFAGWWLTIRAACSRTASAAVLGVTVKQVMTRSTVAAGSPQSSPTLSHDSARRRGANRSSHPVTSATVVIYGKAIWDPIDLTSRMTGIGVGVALIILTLDTMCCNLAANLVGPAYDFSSLWPKGISYRAGGMITATVLAVFFVPVFFVVVRGFFKGSKRQRELQAEAAKNRQIDPGEGATPAKEGA